MRSDMTDRYISDDSSFENKLECSAKKVQCILLGCLPEGSRRRLRGLQNWLLLQDSKREKNLLLLSI